MIKKKVIHLIPYDGTGGVESAARSMEDHSYEDISFKIQYVFKNHATQLKTLNPFIYLNCAYSIFKQKPDLLIVSLWRSCIAALLAKLILPNVKVVLFLHYPKNVHFIDKFFTNFACYISDELWSDSQATFEKRILNAGSLKKKVISFVTHRIDIETPSRMSKNFIFWGRLHQQKGLDRAIEIFNRIKLISPESKFFIIGPDGGEEKNLKNLVSKLQLETSVEFCGEMNFKEIKQLVKDASFYLQPSILEGMAMSVVEAMQLGLVPIVTPVGEINNYCVNKFNAILIDKNNLFLEDVNKLLFNHDRYMNIRKNAINSWTSNKIYHESVYSASSELMSLANVD